PLPAEGRRNARADDRVRGSRCRGMPGHGRNEVDALQHEELNVRDRVHRRGTRDVTEQSDLPEVGAGPVPGAQDLHLARVDDVEPVAGVTLTKDVFAPGHL